MGSSTRKIFIVGPNRFQNEILAAFIDKETSYACLVAHHLEDVPSPAGTSVEKKTLVLLDCMNLDSKVLHCLLQRKARKHLKNSSLALFNLGKGLGVEKVALTCGVRGLFYDEDPGDSLHKGIRTIFEGELWVTRKTMTECLSENGPADSFENLPSSLTVREGEILSLLAMGATNVAIADQLCISPHTVKTHIYNIFKKIDVPNRMQAALWAAKNL